MSFLEIMIGKNHKLVLFNWFISLFVPWHNYEAKIIEISQLIGIIKFMLQQVDYGNDDFGQVDLGAGPFAVDLPDMEQSISQQVENPPLVVNSK